MPQQLTSHHGHRPSSRPLWDGWALAPPEAVEAPVGGPRSSIGAAWAHEWLAMARNAQLVSPRRPCAAVPVATGHGIARFGARVGGHRLG